MDCAMDRLPSSRTLLTSWVTSGELYTGSAINGRRGAGPLRGMSALLLLRAVPAASLLAVLHALGVQRAADDLVADPGEVLHPAAADQHDGVLLQVVALAGDVGGDLDLTGQLDPGHLPQRRVRLLRGGGVDAGADPAALGRTLQGRRLGLADLVLTALADQLLDRGHVLATSLSLCRAAASAGLGGRARSHWCAGRTGCCGAGTRSVHSGHATTTQPYWADGRHYPTSPHRGESVRLRLDQCLVPRAGRTIAGPGVPIGLPVLHLSTPDGAGRRQARPQRWVLALHHTGP